MASFRVWMVGFGLLAGLSLLSAAPPDQAEIDRLIRQMGSPKFTERESATQALDQIGVPALEALRQAADKDEDMEIRRRAGDLVKNIDKRAEAQEILTPTLVKLNYKDVPVADAIADLAKRAGYSDSFIIADADRIKLAERKVSLETSELSFWEALDQLCDKAAVTNTVGGGAPAKVAPGAGIEVVPQIAPAQGKIVRPRPQPDPNAGKIVITDAKPAPTPTCYAGALRIRAVSANAVPQAKGETNIMIEVSAEPKMQWRGFSTIRLEKAVDEKNQSLTQLMLDDVDLAGNPALEDGVVVIQANGGNNVIIIKQVQIQGGVGFVARPPGQGTGVTQMPVRLKIPDGAGKTVKELKGVIVGQVQTPKKPIITIDKVLESANKTFKGKEGSEIKVLEAKKLENGDVQVQIEMVVPRNNNAAGVPGANIQLANAVVGGVPANQGSNITLHDEDGKAYQASVQASSTKFANGVITYTQRYLFRPGNEKAVPKQLVYAGSRIATIEIPFELKDVPMP